MEARIDMAFMKPQYEHGACPDCVNLGKPCGQHTEEPSGRGWWCRLSASGYLDCTDWSGPYPTEGAARNAIEDTYDVDCETGEDLNNSHEYEVES